MIPRKLFSRMMKYTIIDNNHWLWNGTTNVTTGHGLVSFNSRQYYVHRLAFCLAYDLDYDDKTFLACHKQDCNNPNCWNYEHIYKGTRSSNMKDIVSLGYHKEAIKTHCPRGHELWHKAKNGKRVCLECNRLRDKNRKRYTSNGRRYTIPGTRKI